MNVWEQHAGLWIRLWRAGGLFAIGVYALLGARETGIWQAWLLTAIMAGWFVAGMWKRVEAQLGSFRLPAVLYLILGWAIWVALTTFHPLGYLLLFTLYGQLHIYYEPPSSYVLNGLLTLVVVFEMSILGSLPPLTVLATMVLWTIIGASIVLFIQRVIQQSNERRQLIEALETARDDLARSQRQAGIMEERQRLANEIHDTLAQGFASVVMHLESVSRADDIPPRVYEHLDAAKSIARSSLSEARRFVWALRPEILEMHSLAEGIRKFVETWSQLGNIPAEVHVNGTPAVLRPEQDVALLRVVQEALANVSKHARATQVNVSISYLPGVVLLDIQDNGQGFIPDTVQPTSKGGYGLIGMRERIQRLGGSLIVESTPGEGTTLVVELLIGEKEGSILDALG